jgi:hypothetical protein
MTAEQAVEYGIIDGVIASEPPALAEAAQAAEATQAAG